MAHVTTTTKTKTGFQTPVWEPVGIDLLWDWPRLPTTLPTVTSLKCPPLSALAEGDLNQEQEDSVPLEQEDSAPQVENLFGNEEDSKEEALKPVDPSLSE
jgi:hypothetical protein